LISLPPRSRRYRPAGFLFLGLLFLMSTQAPVAQAAEKEQVISLKEHLSLGIKTELLLGSHTSYEFGNPFPPYQSPLSRLTFPLDAWWAGAEVRFSFPRFSLGVEGLTNLSKDAGGLMEDSDWDDEAQPRLKTIYSESQCRLDQSYLVNTDIDLKVSDWLGLPTWFDLRPVTGFRWQIFNLVTHDGTQYDLVGGDPPLPLPGDGIRFSQTYRQYFLGLRSNLDLGKLVRLNHLTMLLQLDWAYAEGQNQDHHLLRKGERFTYEDTTGQAWHGAVGLQADLLKHLSLVLKADFLRIMTTGSHRLVNAPLDLDATWSYGVKVWSDQNRLSLVLQYNF
jgi:Omptin family